MIWILGAGGIGAGIGGLLHRAGHPVTLVARGAHLAALRDHGLLLRTPQSEERMHIATAERVDGPGLVILAVKSQHTASVLPQLTGRRVAIAQNGLENERVVGTVAERVHPMMVWVAAQHLEPGVVDLFGHPHPGVIDCDDDELAALLRSAGFDSRNQPDIMAWKRAKLLTNLGGACQVLGWSFEQAKPLWEEGRRVFEAAGLAHRTVEELLERVSPYKTRPIDGRARVGGSMFQDHTRGRPLELAWLNGELQRLARAHGVATPVNDRVMAALGG